MGPDFTKWYAKMFTIQETLSIVIVSLLIIINIAVLIRLKFKKLDAWGYFTLTLHLIVSGIRLYHPDLE